MEDVLGDAYILGELLGQGGMGLVYAAEQRSLGRSVAIKLMHPHLATVPEIVERFRIEALAGGRLVHPHPHVVGVLDFGTTASGVPFLVMERVTGEPLGRIIEREGALPLRRTCELVLQILAGLGEVHSAGVVHADIKSDNILVDCGEDGDVATVIDFGIATLIDHPVRHTVDEQGRQVLSGTPEYIAPEVIQGERPTALSDLYSVGIILYELITGVTPFVGGTALEILRRQRDEDVVAPTLRRPDRDIPPALDRLVMRVLAKEPIARYQSAACFARALREVMPEHESPAALAPSAFSSETPTQEWHLDGLPPASSARRRLADGTRPQPHDRRVDLQSAIGAAIRRGSLDDIATSYLAFARHLVDLHGLETGVKELEQAVDILTLGEGPFATNPPPQLWRVLLAQAALLDGIGDRSGARRAAHAGDAAASRVSSTTGRDRARSLLRRLAPVVEGAAPNDARLRPALVACSRL